MILCYRAGYRPCQYASIGSVGLVGTTPGGGPFRLGCEGLVERLTDA